MVCHADLTASGAVHIVGRMNALAALHRDTEGGRRLWKAPLLAVLGGSLLGLTQLCFAAHWQEVGPAGGGAPGQVYMDMDSVRQDEGYRVAVFLTIYAGGTPNSHNIRLDRITQETAFDCKQRQFALLETLGYFRGKKVGGSSAKEGEWKERFRAVPQDPFSQRALDLACNAPLAPQPEPAPPPADAAASVRLPGPGGVITGGPESPTDH